MHNQSHDAATSQEQNMKKNITRAKIGSVICSSAKNPDGSPVWSLSKDGSVIISQELVYSAAVRSGKITA